MVFLERKDVNKLKKIVESNLKCYCVFGYDKQNNNVSFHMMSFKDSKYLIVDCKNYDMELNTIKEFTNKLYNELVDAYLKTTDFNYVNLKGGE